MNFLLEGHLLLVQGVFVHSHKPLLLALESGDEVGLLPQHGL
jgi:hypothetical protein